MVDTARLARAQTTGRYVVLSNANQLISEEGRPDLVVTLLMDGEPVDAAMKAARHAYPKDACSTTAR
ncbi:hypothetical protein R8510_01749 [Ralstonia chuxiongensis]|nr:hypothetical protein R8510_01749 [Ralstonia chuxiongensis]